ncbi:hypothetical protein AX15_006031 [Amanita polypyramis BW_CC]|nr:hypothetical protein AX15_006031 [Amanita polypyramis BW_CC]
MFPSQRLPARPCPFYQHGRCLFADSCNFLHTVSVRPSPGVTIIDPPRKLEQVISHSYPTPPIVTIDSPRSLRSPPRSPRLSGLLHALRDVIGDDPEEEEACDAFEDAPPNLDLPKEEHETLTAEERGNFVSSGPSNEEEGLTDEVNHSTVVSDDSPIQPAVASSCNHDSSQANEDPAADETGIEGNEPTVRAPIPSRDSIDTPLEPQPDSTATQASHRKSISMSLGLPNRSSLNRPPHLRLGSPIPHEIDLSMKDSAFVIDSGYAESWHPPSPPTLTPPRTPIRSSTFSTLDLLSSPFGSPSVRMRSQVGFLGRLSFHTTTTTEDDGVSEISLDCPANCESPRHELEKDAPGSIQLVTEDGDVANKDVLQSDMEDVDVTSEDVLLSGMEDEDVASKDTLRSNIKDEDIASKDVLHSNMEDEDITNKDVVQSDMEDEDANKSAPQSNMEDEGVANGGLLSGMEDEGVANGGLLSGMEDEDVANKDVVQPDMEGEDIANKSVPQSNMEDEDIANKDVLQSDLEEEDVANKDSLHSDMEDEDVANKDVPQSNMEDEGIANKDVLQSDIEDEDVANKDVLRSDMEDEDIANKDVLQSDIEGEGVANKDALHSDIAFPDWSSLDGFQSDGSISPEISFTVKALDSIAREVRALKVPTVAVVDIVNVPDSFRLESSETDISGPKPTQVSLSAADDTTDESKGVVDTTVSDSVATFNPSELESSETDVFGLKPTQVNLAAVNNATDKFIGGVDSTISDAVAMFNPPEQDEEQFGANAIFSNDKSIIWEESTPHQSIAPGSTDDSQISAPQVEEVTAPEYILEDASHRAATAVAHPDFYSEEPASNNHTPNLTADVGDDDNVSSESLNSSTRLAYLASPALSEPDNNMHQSVYEVYSNSVSPSEGVEHPSMPIQLESSPVSFRPSFSNSSPINAPSHERAFFPASDTRIIPTKRSSSSPVSSRPFSPRNRTVMQSTCETSPQSSARSSASESSRKISFGWRSSGSAQSRTSEPSVPKRTSSKMSWRTTSSFSDRNSLDGRHSDIVSPTHSAAGGLKPLKLSSLISSQHGSFKSSHRSSNGSYTSHSRSVNRTSISSSVSSAKSSSYNLLLSPARISAIPEHIRNSITSSRDSIPSPLSEYSLHLKNFGEARSAPVSPHASWHSFPSHSPYDPAMLDRAPSRASEPALYRIDEQEDGYFEEPTVRQPTHIIPYSSPVSQRSSALAPTVHAIATPKPTLFFAIASDNVDEVRKVLESGEAGPNETIGPQSALEFSMTNDQLTHKMEIVKLLLAHGANPSVARNQLKQKSAEVDAPPAPSTEPILDDGEEAPESDLDPVVRTTILDTVDPATRYYVEKAEAPETRRTSVLMHRSSFRALTRVRYEFVGQDRALEQLFKVLSIHTRHLSATPIVVLLCGPSGHGKSLLARKFGSLLDVPTHTVNMTTLKSTHDLWKSYSMSPYETPTTCTLAEFLINNEGKRCVVVLDEIEKTEDEKALWSLLMPWELGRCSIEAGSRHVDVRNVVWLGTSNIGHDMILKYQNTREHPEEPTSQQEYTELMGLLRPKVSERLGASVLSRVTTVLPFVPFTREERKVICSEALYTLAGDAVRDLSPQAVEKMIDGALASYCSEEGARSLHRAISSELVNNI